MMAESWNSGIVTADARQQRGKHASSDEYIRNNRGIVGSDIFYAVHAEAI
jgi:hypothetical protein